MGATWHWSDLTFIEPSVVKTGLWKMSTVDIERFRYYFVAFEIAGVGSRYRSMNLSEST